ncbi:hypothetical protein CBL_09508 [Carabus blaptoides fortunei]
MHPPVQIFPKNATKSSLSVAALLVNWIVDLLDPAVAMQRCIHNTDRLGLDDLLAVWLQKMKCPDLNTDRKYEKSEARPTRCHTITIIYKHKYPPTVLTVRQHTMHANPSNQKSPDQPYCITAATRTSTLRNRSSSVGKNLLQGRNDAGLGEKNNNRLHRTVQCGLAPETQ